MCVCERVCVCVCVGQPHSTQYQDVTQCPKMIAV